MNRPTLPPRASPGPVAALLLGVALAGAGCASSPIVSLPVPPPPVDLWQAVATHGSFLGLKPEENDSRSLDALFFEPGVRVVRVVENSPAARAGLRAGDVVLAAGGHELFDPDELQALVHDGEPGDTLQLEVQRGDAVFDIPVVLAAAAGGAAAPREPSYLVDPARARAAWADAEDGVRLASLADDSPLHDAGLAPGALVVGIEGAPVRSARALLRRLETHAPGSRVELLVREPDGAARPVRTRLAAPPRRITGFNIPILVEWEAEPDGSKVKFELVDIWILSLFRYERVEGERTWTLLSLFDYSTGVGSLGP